MEISSIEGLKDTAAYKRAEAVKNKLKGELELKAKQAKALADKLAAEARDAAEKVATIGLAPGRGAFLLLVQFNVRGFATRLAAIDQQKLRDKWNQLGGNFTTLTEAITKGKTKKVLLGTNGTIGEPVTISTAIVTAAPVIVAIVALLKQLSPGASEEELNGITTDAEAAFSAAYGGDMSGFDFVLQKGKETPSANENLKNDPSNTGTSDGGGTNTGGGTNDGGANTGGVNFGELLKKYWWLPAGLIVAKVAKII